MLDLQPQFNPTRRMLLAAAGCLYAVVFVVFAFMERPGLGIGHAFYLAIVLAAVAGGPLVGAFAGIFATVLYVIGIAINPEVSTSTIPTLATVIRLIAYVLVGSLIGYYSALNRRLLVHAEDLSEELRLLTRRDFVTDLPSQRAFENKVSERIARDGSFLLLVADVVIDESLSSADQLLAVAESITRLIPIDTDSSRVGNSQLAFLLDSTHEDGVADGRTWCNASERHLGTGTSTFGWSQYPRDGNNALSLYMAACERMYVRKMAKERSPASTALVE
jgi:predicted signal transduction protein with EAL and GGDEF domain